MIEERLRPDERDAVNAFLGGFAVVRGLDEWLQLWQSIVEEMCDGYDLTKWDYENDLDGRDIIDKAAALLSPETRSLLDEAIRPWNEEFRCLTVESSEWLEWLSGGVPASPQRWWWSRVPRKWPGR